MDKRRFRPAVRDGVTHMRTDAWKCLYCGGINDALSLPGVRKTPKPKPGDALICMTCAQIMLVDASLNPSKPDLATLMAIRVTDPQFARSLDRIQSAHRKAFPLS